MPKKKGSNKKLPKVKTPTLRDALTEEELAREREMMAPILKLREELDKEKEQKNYCQLERDHVQTFWEVSQRELNNYKAELKNLEKEIEEKEQHHCYEIKAHKERVKHLLCEQQDNIAKLDADARRSMEEMQKQQEELENELQEKMADIQMNMPQHDIENIVNELEMKHDEEMTDTRNRWERQLTEIMTKYENKLEELQQELHMKSMTEISEREDHWNSLINAIITDHRKMFDDVVTQLNNSVQHNLELKESPMKQIKSENWRVKQMSKELRSILQDNKNLNESLSKIKDETEKIERKLKFPMKAKNPNEKIKERRLVEERRDLEILQVKFKKLTLEKDQLYEVFTDNIEKVQKKTDWKSLQLEEELRTLTEKLDITQTQLLTVLSASHRDPVFVDIIQKIESFDKTVTELGGQRNKISKAQQELRLFSEKTANAPEELVSAEPS
ncbi:dynein regulatory complex subunit 4-like [Synchiropus picturatus]